MSQPFREHMEVYPSATGKWIRCAKCLHLLCQWGEDWRAVCKRKTFSPTKAGPLMGVLVGRYLLEKLYCPSCGVLFSSDMIEETGDERGES